jgi:hypothetical protein
MEHGLCGLRGFTQINQGAIGSSAARLKPGKINPRESVQSAKSVFHCFRPDRMMNKVVPASYFGWGSAAPGVSWLILRLVVPVQTSY